MSPTGAPVDNVAEYRERYFASFELCYETVDLIRCVYPLGSHRESEPASLTCENQHITESAFSLFTH